LLSHPPRSNFSSTTQRYDNPHGTMIIHVAPMRFRDLLKCKHKSNDGIPYQEVVVHERPGLPRDDLRPLRTPLSQSLDLTAEGTRPTSIRNPQSNRFISAQREPPIQTYLRELLVLTPIRRPTSIYPTNEWDFHQTNWNGKGAATRGQGARRERAREVEGWVPSATLVGRP
jgi:hypothetical protein